MAGGSDKPASDNDLTRALALVTEILRTKGRETGANLGHALRREFPSFDPHASGFTSLSHMLREAADDLVIVDRKGDDRVWALGEYVSDRDIDHALGPETEAADEASIRRSQVPTYVELINFRSCRNTRLELADSGITVLVGANGSGKSTVLYGSSYISQVTRGKLRALFSGTRDVRRLRTNGATQPMELAIGAGGDIELRLKAEPTEDDTKFIVSLKHGRSENSWTSPGSPPMPPLPRRQESAIFWPSVLLRFRANALATPSDVVEGEPRLSFDGSGLPTLLAYLANFEPTRLQEVVERVRRVVPDVEETRQRLRRWEPYPGQAEPDKPVFQYQLDVKMKGDGWVPADLLSEGTLFSFGIHTVLHQRQPPRLVILDDVDRGLHPRAQRALVQQLKTIAADHEGPRLIVSTHSPYILDELPAESVRVVRSVQGATEIRALVDHPEWQEWQTSMTSGEFWTYVGEDWMEATH
jgi:predicted ATPase